jgi:hypothetical protein
MDPVNQITRHIRNLGIRIEFFYLARADKDYGNLFQCIDLHLSECISPLFL